MILIPLPDFQSSARCLDTLTLGSIRFRVNETVTDCLFGSETCLFSNHIEEYQKWKGHEYSLISYGFELCTEWKLRGNIDTVYPRLADLLQLCAFSLPPEPKWLLSGEHFKEHQRILLERDYEWYKRYFDI